MQKTKTTPSVDWCINRDYSLAELYKYRADLPEVLETIKDLKKAKVSESKESWRNIQEQHWYNNVKDFMKANKKAKEVTKKPKVKKSVPAPIESKDNTSAVQEHNETLNAKDLIKLLKVRLFQNQILS